MGSTGSPPPLLRPPSWSQTFAHYQRTPPPLHPHAGHSTPAVYSRDFAYANGRSIVLAYRPMRVERASVSGSSARNFAELLSGPTIDVYVGPQRRHWSLHHKLLCYHSSYFETEFKGHQVSQSEGNQEQTLSLPHDDPRGFELLVKWLYQGQLEDVSDIVGEERKYEYAVACHKLYVLCDKFDMIALKNIAMDQYRCGLHEAQLVPDADEINEIYRASPPGCAFRSLMTRIAARQIMDPETEQDAESYRKCFEDNPDFAIEMVNAIRSMSGGILFEDPTEGNNCDYHDHSNGSGYSGHEKGKGKAKLTVNGAE